MSAQYPYPQKPDLVARAKSTTRSFLIRVPDVSPKKKKDLAFQLSPSNNGAPGAIRTPDPLVRSQVLYPTELRALK